MENQFIPVEWIQTDLKFLNGDSERGKGGQILLMVLLALTLFVIVYWLCNTSRNSCRGGEAKIKFGGYDEHEK